MSHKVIQSGIIRYIVYGFLLVLFSNFSNGLANKFGGGLWLSTFHGGLRRLTMVTLGSTSHGSRIVESLFPRPYK